MGFYVTLRAKSEVLDCLLMIIHGSNARIWGKTELTEPILSITLARVIRAGFTDFRFTYFSEHT